MKLWMFKQARRPVPSGRFAQIASVLPARACRAQGMEPNRLAVRGCAVPGQAARHCSPPTAFPNGNVNIWRVIGSQSVCLSEHCSYEYESFIQTHKPRILLAHQCHWLGALTPNQATAQKVGLNAPRVVRGRNRQARFEALLLNRIPCRTHQLSKIVVLRYHGSASTSVALVTTMKFRLVACPCTDFGKIKPVVASFCMGLTICCSVVDVGGMARMLGSCSSGGRSLPSARLQFFTGSHPTLFPFAFRRGLFGPSDDLPKLLCWLCRSASLAKSAYFCPFAPDGRVAIECPGNGPHSIAVHSTTVPVDNRWRWSGPSCVFGRIGWTAIQVAIQNPAAHLAFTEAMPVNDAEQARPMPRTGSKKFQAKKQRVNYYGTDSPTRGNQGRD